MNLEKILKKIRRTDPNKTAIIYNNETTTYEGLTRFIDRAKSAICQNGAINAQMVSIYMPRSVTCIAMTIALLELNIPYVLIPYDTPKNRNEFIRADSRSEFLVTIGSNVYEFEKLSPTQYFPYKDAAFLIYTSGSTGRPKGVVLHRKALAFFLETAARELLLSNYLEVHLASTPFSFDLHVFDIYMPLVLGKTVVLTTEDETKNPRSISKLIIDHAVDSLLITPTKMLWLIRGGKKQNVLRAVKSIVLAGEHLQPSLVKSIQDISNARIINAYGPTEATVFVTWKSITDAQAISIGSALTGDEIILLDEHMNSVKDGIEGEICIAGPSLAAGYINESEDANQNFTTFCGKRIYRTGDMGYKNGQDFYIKGRKDRQIKMNGYRIELDEIERFIYQSDLVDNCAISFDQKNNGIVAYYEAGTVITESQWYDMLEIFLPHYMFPNKFIQVQKIKLNQNGKVDHQYYDRMTYGFISCHEV